MRGWDCKLSVNVVVSRNASQSNEVPIVPILRSVTGTLRIAAGLLTPGIRASSCESKTLTPFSPPRWLLHHLIKINHLNQRQEAHDFDKNGCSRLHESANYIQSDWLFQNHHMYVCMYVHTLTQARQDLPSSRHPVKDGLKKSHTALPDKCDCYSTVVSIHTEMKTQTTGRVSNSRRKERGISIMQILLCSLHLLCFTS